MPGRRMGEVSLLAFAFAATSVAHGSISDFAPAVLPEFLLEPRWLETWWARLLAVSGLMAAIVQFVRWRLRESARRQAELESIVAARTENLRAANEALDEKARQLRSSEDRLRLLLQQAPAGIFVFDGDLRVSECNDQFLSLLQSGAEAGGAMALSKLAAPGARVAIQAALEGREGNYEGPLAMATGSGALCVALSTAPLRDDNGLIRSGIGLAVDITERKRMEEALRHSEERFRLAIKATNDAIWDVDLEAGIVTWNETYSALYGRPPETSDSWQWGSTGSIRRTGSAPSRDSATRSRATARGAGPANTGFSGRMADGRTSTTALMFRATRPAKPGA